MNPETGEGRAEVTPRKESGCSPCPHCRALEARVTELEKALEASGASPPPGSEARAGTAGGWPSAVGFRGVQGLAAGRPRRLGSRVGAASLAPAKTVDERESSCLPLPSPGHCQPVGWQVLCPTDVYVTWDGSPGPGGLRVAVDPRFAKAIKSQFGSEIVTFSPRWLFRTSPGWDLYVKGPGNRWKVNCVALEGVVET